MESYDLWTCTTSRELLVLDAVSMWRTLKETLLSYLMPYITKSEIDSRHPSGASISLYFACTLPPRLGPASNRTLASSRRALYVTHSCAAVTLFKSYARHLEHSYPPYVVLIVQIKRDGGGSPPPSSPLVGLASRITLGGGGGSLAPPVLPIAPLKGGSL